MLRRTPVRDGSDSRRTGGHGSDSVDGLPRGYFSRRLLVTKSAGVVKKALGAVLQYGITNFIAKKGDDENDEYPKKKNVLRRILSI